MVRNFNGRYLSERNNRHLSVICRKIYLLNKRDRYEQSRIKLKGISNLSTNLIGKNVNILHINFFVIPSPHIYTSICTYIYIYAYMLNDAKFKTLYKVYLNLLMK
jgi:hypothetical protein